MAEMFHVKHEESLCSIELKTLGLIEEIDHININKKERRHAD